MNKEKSIHKYKALEGMLKDGWSLEDNTVETMDIYRQFAIEWLEENIELSEHIGFVLDYISNLEKMLEEYKELENEN